MDDWIRIKGARQHNLKNVDVDIPRRALTGVSGLSGSGKSSLVFDTLYAEGQRCYVESLSTYARQFLARLPKPDVDWIDGISPAIAIEQRNAVTSGRSTVGTVTEINDYLRVLFARVGRIVCPTDGEPVTRETPDTVWKQVRQLWEEQAPVLVGYPQESTGQTGWTDSLVAQGFQRVVLRGEVVRLEDAAAGVVKPPRKGEALTVVIDRLTLAPASRARFVEAVELAFRQSGGWVTVRRHDTGDERAFSSRLVCNACGRLYPEPTPRLFSFNSPEGACPACRGFGNKLEFDEARIVPDPSLSLRDGAVKPWSTESFARQLSGLFRFCARRKIPIDRPWSRLTREQQLAVLEARDKSYTGVIPYLEAMRAEMKKAHHRFFTRRYMSDTECRSCRGSRLRPEALAVTIGGLDLGQLGRLAVGDALRKVSGLRLTKSNLAVAGEVLDEVISRLRFLERVGLGYLTLDRLTRTLSGGEAQRIHLANSLGSRLVDTLYVLDEPTCGLHAADCERLVATLLDLVAGGNTVVVVEHDLEVLRRAEYFIELGPGAGHDGGHVVYQGPLADLLEHGQTLTARYLRAEVDAVRSRTPREGRASQLVVKGARLHNLRELDLKIPLQRFTALTGVSGSGKSSFLNGCLHDGLTGRALGGAGRAHPFTAIQGGHAIGSVVRVDQTPIGKTSRSNPATYLQLLAAVRELFAGTRDALARGYPAGRFSFNTAGGRCAACQGLGFHRVEMQFMADIELPCEECGGKRFNPQTLEIRYRGRNIAEVLELTVAEALQFFGGQGSITDKLWLLKKVGLGYLKLGQPAPTLSGGESQRLKIARELVLPSGKKNLYLLDEPTTGLHADDVQALVTVLHELVDRDHTVVVIEHNLDLIAQADWVIDLGPGGGEQGGRLVAQGTPREVAADESSVTGRFLAVRLAGGRRHVLRG
ncbi:MAG TPA: excinuclease ABC subunit UvrA [Candidatus Krumholzibacteria bacterium]|nr:excinuclease ABC subunit UvrA [Candidatus Krumholzibacteria bacterium]HPD71084.1 excinuclease ABC subunit UvrA [Candidatus Krumholzibacteria bacterium]HRY39216.1 excinuclease ABC subunit UvrA [Candidatus Krumholzibacteria bacterium]